MWGGGCVRACARACVFVRACVRACVCVLVGFSFSCLQGEGFRQTAGKYHAILRYKLLRRREFRSVHDLSGQNHDFFFYSLSTGRLEEGERFPSGMIYQSEICIHPAFHQRNYSRHSEGSVQCMTGEAKSRLFPQQSINRAVISKNGMRKF